MTVLKTFLKIKNFYKHQEKKFNGKDKYLNMMITGSILIQYHTIS